MSIQERPPEQTIILKKRPDYWLAIDEETGVGAQAPTRAAALAELDEAIALYNNDATALVEDEDAVFRELGIDPTEVDEDQSLPVFMSGVD